MLFHFIPESVGQSVEEIAEFGTEGKTGVKKRPEDVVTVDMLSVANKLTVWLAYVEVSHDGFILLPCDAMRCTVLVIVILSVRPSICLSVTLVACVHMVRTTIMISSPYGSPIILVSGDITLTPKFEGGHPERGRWMRVGCVRIGHLRPISRRISETMQDTTKVTINH